MPGPERARPPAPPGYACADTVVLRAALAPRAPTGVRGPDRRAPEDPGRLHDLIRAVRDDRVLAAAIELASPPLAGALLRPWPETAAGRRRMTIALTGYLLRLQHRATPFGLFAGTALVPLAEAAAGGLGERHRLLLRPSPRWLAGLVAAAESGLGQSGSAGRVRIAASPSLHTIGGVHVLADPGSGASGPGHWRAGATVSPSRLLDAVLAVAAGDRAGGGIGYPELLDLLCAASGLDREQLTDYVAGLLTARLLVTDLLPAPGDADPLRHLVERLADHPLAARLSAVRRDLARPLPAPGPDDVRRLRARLRAVRERDADLSADTLLDHDLRLPSAVAREVARAASVAWACAPPPAARPLAGLHQAMLNRYGLGRPVPLTELLDLTGSLGLHRPPPAVAPAAASGARDRLLTGLALDALAAGRAELRVGRAQRSRLAAMSGAGGPAPSVDICTEIVTTSAGALDRGDFLVVLGSQGSPGPAGASAGRLAAALGAEAARLAGWPPGPGEAGPLDVEVVFRPPDPAAANLVSETGWTAFRIDLTGQPARRSPRDLVLADLVVIATAERLRVHCERLGRDVRPVSYSALNPRRAGAVAGLLLALGQDGSAPWRSWDWGAARVLPWLPRVRAGQAVLASARWSLPGGLRYLAETGTDRQWRDGLARWRDSEELPEIVFAGAWDQRLPLDLEDPVHAALLRRECRNRGVTAVTEPPGGTAAWRASGWPAGPAGPHTAEFVFALRPPAVPASAVPPGGPPSPGGRPPGGQAFLPGGSWLCASLTVPEALQDSVLAQLAGATLTAAARLAGVDRWFFVRVADPGGVPQLTVRFHGPAGGLHQVLLPALHGWGVRLRDAALALDFSLTTYWPEQWRYGGASCMEAAERFFHCDSMLCLDTLARSSARRELLAAPGVLGILTGLLDMRPADRWPRPRLSAAERRLFTQLRADLRSCADGTGGWPLVTALPPGQRARSLAGWHAALGAYRPLLSDAGQDRARIAWSLVHMHCNRLAGPSRAAERMAVALARDLAMARSAAAG